MSATMARQGSRVKLEQCDMRLALNMAKMAKGRVSLATIDEMQYLIKKPCAKVREEKKQGVEFPGQKKVKGVIERHLATLHRNHTDGCLSCRNGTATNLQTSWRPKGTGAFPANQCRQPTLEPTPSLPQMTPLPGMTPMLPGKRARAHRSQILDLPARYVYSHTSLPCAEYYTPDASAQDSQHDTGFILDMLTDEGTSTG